MKWLLIIVILTAVCCSRLKEVSVKQTSNTANHRQESTYIEKKDTTFDYCPSPERSQNRYFADSSYLETSLARSSAQWKDGILSHTIENKPSIPIRVPAMINLQTRIISDTTVDCLELTTTVIREKYRFLNPLFYYSGIAFWLILIILITLKLWKQYRQHPRF